MVRGEVGRRVWKIVHSIVLATLLCMTADQVFRHLLSVLQSRRKKATESSMSIKIDDVTMGVVSHRCIKKSVKPCYYRNQKQSCMDSLCAMRHKEDR